MLKNLKTDNIYIVCGHTDMRKSIDGLASIVQQHINYTNPISVNINKFLADADLNHVIDVSDVTAININAC